MGAPLWLAGSNSYADVKIAGCVCQKATPLVAVTSWRHRRKWQPGRPRSQGFRLKSFAPFMFVHAPSCHIREPITARMHCNNSHGDQKCIQRSDRLIESGGDRKWVSVTHAAPFLSPLQPLSGSLQGVWVLFGSQWLAVLWQGEVKDRQQVCSQG